MIFPKIELGLISRMHKETEERAEFYEKEIEDLENTITQVQAQRLKKIIQHK